MPLNFSAIPRETRFGRLVRLPLRFLPPGLAMPIFQGPLRGWRWVVGSSDHGCWLGSFENAQSSLFAQSVGTGSVVYDVGAHVGWYTLLASALVGPEGHVYAFEPSTRNLRFLKKHVALNSIQNVTVIESGVGAETASGSFHVGESHTTGKVERLGSGGIPVEVHSLDDLVYQKHLRPPNILKIDVEGGEFDVLRGARSILESRVVLVFLSTHGPKVKRECISLLRRYGYEIRPVDHASVERASEFLASASK